MRKLERITAPGIALACWLVLSAVATDGWAQAAGRPLKEQIESSFEVLPISGGLVLRPKQDMAGIRSLEVRDGELAIDGRDVERRDLELRVGREAAAPVLALLELDEEELEELFVLGPAIEATPSPDARDGDQVDEESDSAIPIPPMPPIPPGLPDAERERLERELERQHEEMRRRIEEAMDGRSEAIQRAQEEMERVQEELDRDNWRGDRRRRSRGDARVVVGTPVRVSEGETSGEIVALGGGLGVDGEVHGDAVAIGGHARIDGTVTGSVVSVGGGVHLGPNARVEQDVVSVGGPLVREPGAEIGGQVTEVSVWQGLTGGWGSNWGWGWNDWETPDYFDGSIGRLVRSIVGVVVLLLFGMLVAALARNQVERVSARVTWEPFKTLVVGALAVVLFIPLAAIVAILLAVSVVGIPLLLLWPFAILACVFLAWFGYFAAAHSVGQWSERRFGWRVSGAAKTTVLGLVLLHVWLLLARFIDVADSSHDVGGFLRIMLWLFWALANLGVLSAGIGGLLVKRRVGPEPEIGPMQPTPYGPGPGPAAGSVVATYAAAAPAARPAPVAQTPAGAGAGAIAEDEAILDGDPDWERRSWDEPFAAFDEPVRESEPAPGERLAGESLADDPRGDEPAGRELADEALLDAERGSADPGDEPASPATDDDEETGRRG
jgi:hypothetical protein